MIEDNGLQRLIGAALVDRSTARTLLLNPLALADQFDLSVSERRFVAAARPRDLEHFAQLVEQWRDDQPLFSGQVFYWPERVQLVS